MAYTGTVTTVAEINIMAGENADATGNTEANVNLLVAQAEAYLVNLVKYDIVTNWASLNTIKKKIFSEWAARYVAEDLIKYNMAGYTDRLEAENMINVNWARMIAVEELIKKADIQDFLEV